MHVTVINKERVKPRARKKPTAPRGRPRAPQRRRPPQLLVQGNEKLGPSLIWSFSLPAGSTCPGKSELCWLFACYAAKGHYRRNAVQAKYLRNLRCTHEQSFIEDVTAEIRTWKIRVLRIHGSGDYYNLEYVQAWTEIARRNPQTRFYFYTRSWRVPELIEPLLRFAALPNVWGWFSCDHETGVPGFPRLAGIRYAWMSTRDEVPLVRHSVDLIFRVRRGSVAKQLGETSVCPHEQGIDHKRGPITCDRCCICFRDSPKDQTCPTRTRPRPNLYQLP